MIQGRAASVVPLLQNELSPRQKRLAWRNPGYGFCRTRHSLRNCWAVLRLWSDTPVGAMGDKIESKKLRAKGRAIPGHTAAIPDADTAVEIAALISGHD